MPAADVDNPLHKTFARLSQELKPVRTAAINVSPLTLAKIDGSLTGGNLVALNRSIAKLPKFYRFYFHLMIDISLTVRTDLSYPFKQMTVPSASFCYAKQMMIGLEYFPLFEWCLCLLMQLATLCRRSGEIELLKINYNIKTIREESNGKPPRKNPLSYMKNF